MEFKICEEGLCLRSINLLKMGCAFDFVISNGLRIGLNLKFQGFVSSIIFNKVLIKCLN